MSGCAPAAVVAADESEAACSAAVWVCESEPQEARVVLPSAASSSHNREVNRRRNVIEKNKTGEKQASSLAQAGVVLPSHGRGCAGLPKAVWLQSTPQRGIGRCPLRRNRASSVCFCFGSPSPQPRPHAIGGVGRHVFLIVVCFRPAPFPAAGPGPAYAPAPPTRSP